jgi:hypothetical protein
MSGCFVVVVVGEGVRGERWSGRVGRGKGGEGAGDTTC